RARAGSGRSLVDGRASSMGSSRPPMPTLRTLALMIALLATRAAAGTWTSHGPEGGTVSSLAVAAANPLVVYAGGPGGVCASTDGGAHWTARNHGLASLDVRAVAVDPGDALTVYTATWGGGNGAGVFKSSDGGASWAPIDVGLASLAAAALAIDPTNSA